MNNKATDIIQWNLNGFYARFEYLKLLVNQSNPSIICVQETNFKNIHSGKLKNYNFLNQIRTANAHASGGVSILIKNNIKYTKIDLNTNLEAKAANVKLDQNINICNIYIPNNYQLKKKELSNLIKQLPSPFIIVGDFNSHNFIWGSQNRDKRGKIIEDILQELNIFLLNNGEKTHFSVASGKESAIDLAICSPSLASKLAWKPLNDLFDSDHYPIAINLERVLPIEPPPHNNSKWNFKKANWPLYYNLTNLRISKLNLPTVNDKYDVNKHLEAFMEIIKDAASIAIPKINAHSPTKRKLVPWWNSKCDSTVKETKKAFNRYKKFPTEENKINYKKLRAKARKTIKESYKSSWRNLLSSFNSRTLSHTFWKFFKRYEGSKPSLIYQKSIMKKAGRQQSLRKL